VQHVLLCPVQILKHDWLVKEGVAYDISLDSVVLKRMKQFAQVRAAEQPAGSTHLLLTWKDTAWNSQYI
jgi:hypothetical protein